MSLATKNLVNSIKGNKSLFGVKNSPSKPGPSQGVVGRLVFNDFCGPAKFYLVIALLTLMYYVSTDQAYIWIIIKAIVFIVWGFLLNKLCQANFKAIAWVFAIVPQCIFIILTMKMSPATPRQPKPAQAQKE
jgi:predicted membrane protein